MIFHGEDLISFHSGRLRTTPLSSTQGEYDIATKAVQTGLALSNTITFALEDLPDFLAEHSKDELGLPMPVYCDNKSACLLSEGGIPLPRGCGTSQPRPSSGSKLRMTSAYTCATSAPKANWRTS